MEYLMKFRLRRLMLIFFVVLSLFPSTGRSEIKYIDLTNPFLRKMPLAIPPFKALTPNAAEMALSTQLDDQFSDMLQFTGYFAILDPASFLYDPQKSGITEGEINYGNWTAVGAELLITGGVRVQDPKQQRIFHSSS